MIRTIHVDSLDFIIDTNIVSSCLKLDEEPFYQNMSSCFQLPCECVQCPSHTCKKSGCSDYNICTRKKSKEGLKAVDLLLNAGNTFYVIEAKDYRQSQSSNSSHIANEVAKKFRDTFFVLSCASLYQGISSDVQSVINSFFQAGKDIQFIFQFEPPQTQYQSGLYQNGTVASPQTVLFLLERFFGEMKSHLTITKMADGHNKHFPWTVVDGSSTVQTQI